MKILSRTVWILSLISLCTDVASEMLYPVMPVYLKSIGFSVLLIGILEGFAEATAGLSKAYFGNLSDKTGKRAIFVQSGYGLSALSKPLLAFFTNAWWIFFCRTTDRVGKGLRTGARDAMLSDEALPETKAKVFGFHRAMDTLGASIGPILALIWLYNSPGQYKLLFLIAFVPGIAAVLLSLILKDKPAQRKTESKKSISFFVSFSYFKMSSIAYKRLIIGLLIFALVNSSDVFLLLKAKEAGLSDVEVIGVYVFYNVIYAMLAFPAGIIADKIGLKPTLLFGILLFAIVYICMGFVSGIYPVLILFFIYAAYAASTESISKAWISNITGKHEVATAIGTYTGFQSICTLFASIIAGAIWSQWNAMATFLITGCVAFLLLIYFALFVPKPA
jgi:MFS family permease